MSRVQRAPGDGKEHHARASSAAVVLNLCVLLFSSVDLVGWWFHIPLLTSAIPHYATMKPNTAFCLFVLAVTALLRREPRDAVKGRLRSFSGDVTAGVALMVSGLSLFEYLISRSIGIDQVLLAVQPERFGDPVGRMSIGTAVCLVLTSTAFLWLDRLPRLSTALVLLATVLPISGLVGFVFQAGPLQGVLWFRSLAVHTALCLLFLEVATLTLRPDREPYHSLTQRWALDHSRRYLLPAITLAPILLALPILWGLRLKRYDAPFALALLVVLLLVIQTYILWRDNLSIGKAEAQLRESERRSSRILHSIGDAVIVTDLDARVTRMNAVAEDLTGWKAHEAAGQLLSDVFRIVNERTRETVENPVDKVRRFGTIVGLANHTLLLRRDGAETHIDDSSAPIFDEKGELTGIVLVFRNVNERKEAEHALQTGDQRLRIALETAQLGSWELDLGTGRMECSRVCKATFGRLPDEPFDYPHLIASIHPEDLPGMQLAVQTAVSAGTDYRAEYRVTWPDETEHWVIASGRTITNAAEEPVTMVGVTMDVTERHKAARALVQSEKLAAVGRLASSIAHEINNPLESVTNLLYLARGSAELSEAHDYLDTAERELRRVSVITSQTLQFHKQATRPTAVIVEDLMGSVLSIYQGKIINSRVEVRQRARATRPVLCLEGEIRQVLSNLVGNAIDIMHPDGGLLLLRSRAATNWRSGQEGIVITVADTGSGMSSRTVAKIFQPFFTTKGISGTGLGLWITHEIITRHQGAIKVRSRQDPGGSGTVFTVFLPYEAFAGAFDKGHFEHSFSKTRS